MYSRSDFMPIQIVKGIQERDMLLNKFNDFAFLRPMGKYQLKYEDYMRPDKISLKLYGTQDYWWVILKCNPKFEDVWNDFVVGGEEIEVLSSDIDPSIPQNEAEYILVDKAEYLYPNAYKVGEYINYPNRLDIQELYSFAKAG